jgi:uncharacterized membrane protein
MFTFYDDELHNLILVADKNVKEIIAYTSSYDFHPPLQYILNKIFFQLFGLNEFWLSIPSIIFILAAIFLCSRLVFKITCSFKYSLLSGIIIAANPLILLLGDSIRWYPVWTFLIVLSFYLFIKLWGNSGKNKLVIITLIIILSLALYTNYQTIPFLSAALITAYFLDRKKNNFICIKKSLIVLIGVFILFIPYLSVFVFHLQGFFVRKEIYQGFTGVSPLMAGGYYIYSVLFGQSIFPWDPVFIILFCIGAASLLIGLVYLFKKRIHAGPGMSAEADLNHSAALPVINFELYRPVLVFTSCLFIIFLISSILSGSIVNRGILFLPMLLVVIISSYSFYVFNFYSKRKSEKKIVYSWSVAIASFLVLWLIGSYNVLTRVHSHKSGLEIPLVKLSGTIDFYERQNGNNMPVITNDMVFTYYLLKETNWVVLSPYQNDLNKLVGKKRNEEINEYDKIIFIRSYPGALMPLKNELDNYADYLFSSGVQLSGPIKLGYDPDYKMKKSFFPDSGIEEWRYNIYVLSPKDSWDVDNLKKISGFKVY